MEYEIDRLRAERKRAVESVVQLYVSSKSLAEFKLKLAADGLESRTGKTTVFGCKLFWFKKMHPVLWKLAAWLVPAASFIALVVGCALEQDQKGIADVLGWLVDLTLTTWTVAACFNWGLFSKLNARLEWLESLQKKGKK